MFQWGIMGGGFISSQFAKGLETVPDMCVGALASRSGRADGKIKAQRYYTSYEELVSDTSIDAIYIGTIHPQHAECVRLCLNAGKPVLCEKPVTINADELKELINLAKEKKVFFMEAMWTRFIPLMESLRQELQNGKYGRIHNIHITFGGPAKPETRRLTEIKLGGGALLDVGVYGVNIVRYLLGEKPVEIHAWSKRNKEGADMDTCIQLLYPGGCLADMVFTCSRKVDNRMIIITEKAELEVPYFWRPDTLYRFAPNENFHTDTLEEKRVCKVDGNGYHYEALEVRRMLEGKKVESPVMSWKESLEIMEELDEIRKICGIVYPQDKE